jgi:hypothetical protein
MLFRRAIGFYPLDAPFKDDYDMEELWICTNINCKTQYVFFDLYYTIPDDRGFFVND